MSSNVLSKPDCTLCPLHKSAKSVCIPGRGNAFQPKILFVGQAPGEMEDEQNKVFAGPAGQLLDMAVKEYGLDSNFMTNAVRCFPGKSPDGGDNEPSKESIRACAGYLRDEIAAVQPGIIVPLGNVALRAVSGRTGILSFAGRGFNLPDGKLCFPLLHPSFILRQPGQLARFEADCKNLAALLSPQSDKRRTHPKVYEVTPSEFQAQLTFMKPPIAFDFETTGIEFAGHRLRCFSISDGERAVWVDYEKDPVEAGRALEAFLRSPIPKCVHNGVFETRWSLGLFGIIPKNLAWDTMLLAHEHDENGAKRLDLLASSYLDVSTWDIAPPDATEEFYTNVQMKDLGPYNALDSLYTRRLLPPLKAQLSEGQLNHYKTILLPLSKLCAKLQHRGIMIDQEWTSNLLGRYRAEMENIQRDFIKRPAVQKLIASLGKKKFNMNSSQQAGKLFFEIMKLPVVERSKKTGRPSAREPALLRIPNAPPEVKMYLDWKTKQTINNNYLEKFPTFCDKKGLIHADFNPARIVTGRIAVTNPPLTNVPDNRLVRGMFVSRWPGGKLVSADYSQLELRLVASEAGDERFIQAFQTGADPHNDTAAEIWGKDFTPLNRAIAKNINFGIAYGVTPYKLEKEYSLTKQMSEWIIEQWKKAHPWVFKWMRKVHEEAKKTGQVVSRFGRVRHFPNIKVVQDEKLLAAMLREAGNFPIQSAGADLTTLACLLVEERMRAQKMKSLLCQDNHDAMIVDRHPKEGNEVDALIVDVMENEVPRRCEWLKVPLKVSIKTTTHWGGAEHVSDPEVEKK